MRQYRVEAGTDLFGVWVVEISYGRIGTAGRSRSYVVRDEEEARRLARSILKRRATAPRRIGVAYRIRELIDPEGWAGSSGSVGTAEVTEDSAPVKKKSGLARCGARALPPSTLPCRGQTLPCK